ncbi:MAG: 23S rRNA (uracil(1939)-C(5))-methyltransferase RlmD [Lachnospiraceae bacterium]|nr:23S rRNA (uracil(1939)-C(5))-methyltransferase RlmD [Lachnospiraceae bacterium]
MKREKVTATNAKPRNRNHSMQTKCPYAKKCGGCKYQGTEYTKQLQIKTDEVKGHLSRFGKVHPVCKMEHPYHYRNKVHAVFHYNKGQIISGTYQEGSHKVVSVEECNIEDVKAAPIVATIRKLLKSFKIKIYNEDTGYGLFRHVLIRTGRTSGQIMVVLVVASPVFPSRKNFTKALLKEHPEITTVVMNINDRHTSMILGNREETLYGKGFIEDSLCDKVFRISPKSFYQVNPVQTEKLYRKAIALAGLTGSETVLDAYCGIGTIGIIAADAAKEVIGVELNKDAVRDARGNARRNGVKNISFYENDAGEFMRKLAIEGVAIDTVFMDPPRAGSSKMFMDAIFKLAPKKVVYVSCNPETMARDIAYMQKNGYRTNEFYPYDMFPHTGHVETVVLMSRTM